MATLLVVPFVASCQLFSPIPSDAQSLFPSASNAVWLGEQWVGGTTFAPERLAAEDPESRGRRIAAWTAEAAQHWSLDVQADSPELVSDGHGPHLVTARDFGDFELWLDWKLLPGGDSGIYLRGYPQVQLWDPANEAEWKNGSDKGSGALWNNKLHERFPLVLADKPTGEWNHMYIKMQGELVTVRLNGKLVVDEVVLDNYFYRDQPILARGPIHLQTHGKETRFRRLFVREL
ncbi:MAG: DUF1080 domain-containing protein [bacterium]|nr:DUF1080 domain-containing protein [bacterium]